MNRELIKSQKKPEIIREANLLFNQLFYDQKTPKRDRLYQKEYEHFFQIASTLRNVDLKIKEANSPRTTQLS